MTAKIVELKAHREGKTAAPAPTNPMKGNKSLLIDSIMYLLGKAGYSEHEVLRIVGPLVLPPGDEMLAHWSDCVDFFFENSQAYQDLRKSVKGKTK